MNNPGFFNTNNNFSIKKENSFDIISEFELITKDNKLYSQIYSSTKKIYSYFEDAIKKFPSLFETDIKTFNESLDYLEKISIPNKSVCARIVETIPGFHCIDCSKY